MDISPNAIEKATKQKCTVMNFKKANCLVAGATLRGWHRRCGWCPECSTPVYYCGHPRPPNPILKDKTDAEIENMQLVRDVELENWWCKNILGVK